MWIGPILQLAGGVAMAAGLTVLFGWPWAAVALGPLVLAVGVAQEATAMRSRTDAR